MKRRLALLLALVILASGCSALTRQDALIISGESLKSGDKEFRIVAAAYVDSCKQVPRMPSDTECTSFRDFGQKWNKAFPIAAELWLTAKDSNDKATLDSATKVITDLILELSKWALKMLAFVAPGGK